MLCGIGTFGQGKKVLKTINEARVCIKLGVMCVL